MRRTCLIAMVALVIFHLPGCFESKVPMASSDKAKIEAKMVGDWTQVVEKDGKRKPFRLRIAKFNEREYFVSWGKENNNAAMTRAYSVNVGDVQILNVQNIDPAADDDERTFLFFKYKISPDGSLVAEILNGDCPLLKEKTFKTSAEFMAFMKKNIGDETLFADPMTFKKAKGLKLRIVAKDD